MLRLALCGLAGTLRLRRRRRPSPSLRLAVGAKTAQRPAWRNSPPVCSTRHAPMPKAGQGRKAFISRVWDAIRTSHPEWGLSEIEFKDMLAGAHRAGQLVLTGADLKNKQNIKEFEDSAILYKNTVWHYVRVED
jgi:hypothetical protein